PDSGAIYINGKKVSSLSSDAASLRNLHLGFVFQFHYLVEDLTAAENIALPQMIAGTSSGKAISHARDMLKRLELDALWQRYPNQLSGGEQQRIALARALINEPKLVLADEPSGNLDPVNSAGIWELMKELNRDLGQAFVIVTHDSDTASKSNKRFELSQGVLSPL
ncbi:MAG: ATP-binding cassette domain-containing protein, partial [Candidatus Cloacimonetes bacterium]|nr:ATP-binding cassette domain-containing protein [Candidatus Cloacimonadota bacterium]